MNIRLSLLAVACVAALLQPAGASGSASSAAGLAPDTPTMIEALRPAATPGMRNLVLRARPEPAASAAMDAAVQARVAALAANAPLALRGMKCSLNELAAGRVDVDALQARQEACARSEDLREGLAAFAERRAPSVPRQRAPRNWPVSDTGKQAARVLGHV